MTTTITTPLADQLEALRAVAKTFTYANGSYRSPLYPGWRIGCPLSGAPYLVAGEGQRLVDMQRAYTFEGAVSIVIGSVA